MASSEKHIHIVSFDVPYPPNYGGVIDVFYKIKSLHKLGVKIHLHCFEYGRKTDDTLNNYCETVHYYERNMSITAFSFAVPFMVNSRKSDALFSLFCRKN